MVTIECSKSELIDLLNKKIAQSSESELCKWTSILLDGAVVHPIHSANGSVRFMGYGSHESNETIAKLRRNVYGSMSGMERIQEIRKQLFKEQ